MCPTALIVEDDDLLRMLATEALSLLPIRVIACARADDALVLLEDAEPVSLVLTDIRMLGKLDGWDLANVIWIRWPKLPVVLTSGHRILSLEELPPQSALSQNPGRSTRCTRRSKSNCCVAARIIANSTDQLEVICCRRINDESISRIF
ncbi:response regulator [Pseudomonas syringae]